MRGDPGPLVLVFSPRDEILNLLTAGLIHSNYRIIEASTSYIAGVKANQYLPDVIIVDVAMDNIRDFLFLTRLERSIRTQQIPVIVSATHDVHKALESIREEVRSAGAGGRESNVQVVEYPFHFKQLVEKIDSMLVRKVKPKPSETVPEQNEAIAEHLFDRQIASDQKLMEIDSTLDRHWAFPFSVFRALDIIETDSSCSKELAKCIEADPGAASAVLKVANTVNYAKSTGRVSNVAEAVVRIGFGETRNLLACLSLIDVTSRVHEKYGFTRSEFWAHSLSTAIIAEKLSTQAGVARPELAFVSGLLHDIGKIPIDNNFKSVFPRLLEETTNRIASFHVVEKYLMGFTHADLGAHLGAKWNFPPAIARSVLCHHDPELILDEHVVLSRKIEESVYVGNILSKAMNLGHSCDEVLDEIPQQMLKDLGITAGPGNDFLESVQTRFRQFYEYLRMSDFEVSQPARVQQPKAYDVAVVYGQQIDFHPLPLALQCNGFNVSTMKSIARELPEKTRIVVFIPDRGSPLELTIDVGGDGSGRAPGAKLRIFLLDGINVREQRREIERSNVVLMDRRRLDLRMVLHVIEDYYYATIL